ncbi:NAD-P-binding protein [Gloeopeniophorella convolvens]|nr:NAD-P-binding protein [Gloeopeniophorella convolvens]
MSGNTTKVWLITGASAGLGLELTRTVLARGDNVIATARSVTKFNELYKDPTIDQTRLRVLSIDVTSPFAEIKQQVDAAASVWGRIDVLVNNAGVLTFGATEEIGAEGMLNVMQTNFIGVVNITNAVLPYMRTQRSGTIVLIGSRSAFRSQMIGIASYSASKAAVHSYGETLSVELEPFGVRVLIAVPGTFNTNINSLSRAGTPISDYTEAHRFMDGMVEMYPTVPKGDPVQGMAALVDVVRGEGRAAGHGEPPLWLFLGEDSIFDVRARMGKIQEAVDGWEDVGSNLGLPRQFWKLTK